MITFNVLKFKENLLIAQLNFYNDSFSLSTYMNNIESPIYVMLHYFNCGIKCLDVPPYVANMTNEYFVVLPIIYTVVFTNHINMPKLTAYVPIIHRTILRHNLY